MVEDVVEPPGLDAEGAQQEIVAEVIESVVDCAKSNICLVLHHLRVLHAVYQDGKDDQVGADVGQLLYLGTGGSDTLCVSVVDG